MKTHEIFLDEGEREDARLKSLETPKSNRSTEGEKENKKTIEIYTDTLLSHSVSDWRLCFLVSNARNQFLVLFDEQNVTTRECNWYDGRYQFIFL